MYNEDRHAEVTMLEACRRRDEALELRVPEKWREERLHVYVAVSNKGENEFGNSQYFGFDGRNGGEMMVGAWVKMMGEGLMMGMEKGEVMGVADCEVDEEIIPEKSDRFEGANLSDTRMNSARVSMER